MTLEKKVPVKKSPAKKATPTIDFGGVKIPVWVGKSKTPAPLVGADIWYEDSHLLAIGTSVKENIPCLLIGETGTGKTSILREVAFKRNQPYVRINLNGYTAPDELIGSKSAQNGSTYFEEGVLIQAMRDGALLVFDEINATPPDCLFAIHSLLDDERKITLPTGTVVTPHPEFRFFATMNPDYEGTKSVNKALADRFGVVLDINPLTPPEEEKYLVKQGIDSMQAKIMVSFGALARRGYKEQTLPIFISTRTLLQWGNLIQKGISLKDAFKFAILGKVGGQFKTAVNDLFHSVIKESPKGTESKFDFIESEMLDKMKAQLKHNKGVLDNARNELATKKAEYVTKNQKLMGALQTERQNSAEMKEIVGKLKQIGAFAGDTDDVLEVMNGSDVAEEAQSI